MSKSIKSIEFCHYYNDTDNDWGWFIDIDKESSSYKTKQIIRITNRYKSILPKICEVDEKICEVEINEKSTPNVVINISDNTKTTKTSFMDKFSFNIKVKKYFDIKSISITTTLFVATLIYMLY